MIADPLGMEFPFGHHLTCARVWQVAGERERMLRNIGEGYTELAARAEKISMPDWRQSYLENILNTAIWWLFGRNISQ